MGAAVTVASRERARPRSLAAPAALAWIVAASFVARAVAAAAHPVPRFMPDEYLYTQMARAIGTGHAPSIRDQPAHFPAILDPILVAPLQAIFSPVAAYRLTQVENALLMALAAIPAYLIARRLNLSSRYALACAFFAVAVPQLGTGTTASPLGYVLVLAAIAAALVAIAQPTARNQAAFFVLAALATLARIQYVVLPVAYIAAAFATDGRRTWRSQRISLSLFAASAVAGLVVGPSRVLGFYSGVLHLDLNGSVAKWIGIEMFMLSFASGVVLVPGAVAALVRPSGRKEKSFAVFVSVFAALLLFEAAVYAANGADRYEGRYLFALLPLVPVAFGLYLAGGRRALRAVVLVAVLLGAAAPFLPVAHYATTNGTTASSFLLSVAELVHLTSGSITSGLALAFVIASALAALIVARRGGGRVALAGVLIYLIAVAIGARLADADRAAEVRRVFVAPDPTWIDDTGLRDVTLVETPGAPRGLSLEQLYWSRSVTHERLLDGASPTDAYADGPLHIRADGSLADVNGPVLWQQYGTTAVFAHATAVAAYSSLVLWQPVGRPRLALLERGRYADAWLAPRAQLTVWPNANGRVHGVVRFVLSLPLGAPPVEIVVGDAHHVVAANRPLPLAFRVDHRGAWTLNLHAHNGGVLADGRAVSVQATMPVLAAS